MADKKRDQTFARIESEISNAVLIRNFSSIVSLSFSFFLAIFSILRKTRFDQRNKKRTQLKRNRKNIEEEEEEEIGGVTLPFSRESKEE